MPETLGRIAIPDYAPTAVFPLAQLDYGLSVVQEPQVAVHRMEAANRKITQRFLICNGAKRFNVVKVRLTKQEQEDLLAFWESVNGLEKPFFFDAPNANGTTTRCTVRFESPDLTFESLTDCLSTAGIVLVEVPTTAAEYTISATLNRFPSAALSTALLDQAQEIVPPSRSSPPTRPARRSTSPTGR